MKDFNNSERAILDAVLRNGALTKSELCKTTGLSWAGISKYVAGLLNRGLLEKISNEGMSGKGRPAGKLDINSMIYCAGISISYSRIQAVICHPRGEIINFLKINLNRDEDPVPEAIKLLENLITPEIKPNIISLGVSFPGLIDPGKREVLNAVYFSEFYHRQIAEEFETALKLDIPVTIERNAVCELIDSLTEFQLEDDILLISLNSGISAAIAVDGKILQGKTGNLALLGHLPCTENEIPCLCGKRGCIDTLVGEAAWQRNYRRISKLPKASDSFCDAIENGMPQAVKMLKYSLVNIIPIIETLLTIFEPENLVFSADLPPSSALIFSTFIEENGISVPNTEFTGFLSAAKGAALMGFLNICKY